MTAALTTKPATKPNALAPTADALAAQTTANNLAPQQSATDSVAVGGDLGDGLDKSLGSILSTTTAMAVSVIILATLAVVAALYLARAFFVPLLIGILASYALRPLVDYLKLLKIPTPLGAGLVLATLVAATCWAMVALGEDTAALIEKLPNAARKMRTYVAREELAAASSLSAPTTMQNIQAAATEFQGTATAVIGGTPDTTSQKGSTPGITNKNTVKGVSVPLTKPSMPAAAPPNLWLRDYLLVQSALLFTVVSQAPIVLLLTYFLLASGNHFRRKLVQLVGPSFSRKKDTVRILDEVNVQIQRYLASTLGANLLVGVATWLAFSALNVEQAGAWGIAAGVLHFIPYFGSAVFAAISATAAFMQFGTISDALIVSGTSLVIAMIVGSLIMTWLQSRFARLNAAVLFIALLFFAWLWGIWGLLLGAPLVAITKVVCDHVETLKPVGDFLGA